MKKKNIGSSFDSWLHEEGSLEEVSSNAAKRVLSRRGKVAAKEKQLSKAEAVRRMRGFEALEARDYDRAFSLLLEFAEAGDPTAQSAIGSIYQLELASTEEFKASCEGRSATDIAVTWYTRASARGNGLASNNLGTIAHQRGERDEAIRWYRKAARQGFEYSPRPSSIHVNRKGAPS
jgi:TPR repeat protein